MKTLKSAMWIALAVASLLFYSEKASAQVGDPVFDPEIDLSTLVLPPTTNTLPKRSFNYSVCPPRAVTHWDKIIFSLGKLQEEGGGSVEDPARNFVIRYAKHLRIRPFSPLDIKVLDNPREVADLKEKVAVFLLRRAGGAVTRAKIESLLRVIHIADVDYAIVCSALPHFQPTHQLPIGIAPVE